MSRWLSGRTRARFKLASIVLVFLYLAICVVLFFYQRQLIYRSNDYLSNTPAGDRFGRSYYENVWIPAGGRDRIHGWWLPAPKPDELYRVLEGEPAAVVNPQQVVLLFRGVGNNMGDTNYVYRATSLRQLGFSVLIFDYRGWGWSSGGLPYEERLYEDGEIVWNYLRDVRGVSAENVAIYGASLGGAIALNVAVNHPEASALILQSTFTTMADAIKSKPIAGLFPIDWLLTERFDSLAKVQQLQMPVLFIHGSRDSVVPPAMSKQLYDATPTSKQLFYVEDADHVAIWQPGVRSYLRAVYRFVYAVTGDSRI